jgi:hypothetical protein
MGREWNKLELQQKNCWYCFARSKVGTLILENNRG